jgi:hypothetical protein
MSVYYRDSSLKLIIWVVALVSDRNGPCRGCLLLYRSLFYYYYSDFYVPTQHLAGSILAKHFPPLKCRLYNMQGSDSAKANIVAQPWWNIAENSTPLPIPTA